MAESDDDTEKSEDPTQKRLDDALKRGDVVKSQEVNTWFVIGGATLALVGFAGPAGRSLESALGALLANIHKISFDRSGLMQLFVWLELRVIAAMAIPILLLVLAAIAGNMVQHRLVWSAESLKPKFSKISPLAGFKRLFSKQSLMNFVKGLAKLGIVGAVLTMVLWPERFRLESFISIDVAKMPEAIGALSFKLMGAVAAILSVIAAGDYLFQYRVWFNKHKMSLHDIKEEFKETEGDPAIKGRIRQMREKRARSRMMAAVPTASVVITNPTHFAVALKYERGMSAPVCVAKGKDLVALRIRELAKDNFVPVVENPPLARALYATTEIEDEVPAQHYKAVAEVIGYVMRLRSGIAGRERPRFQ